MRPRESLHHVSSRDTRNALNLSNKNRLHAGCCAGNAATSTAAFSLATRKVAGFFGSRFMIGRSSGSGWCRLSSRGRLRITPQKHKGHANSQRDVSDILHFMTSRVSRTRTEPDYRDQPPVPQAPRKRGKNLPHRCRRVAWFHVAGAAVVACTAICGPG